ncbi:hypothetical protein AMJ83_01650 [candidate division WOR_3 bacterium SM23_42]|uniref:Uncharacterized protein n=1 Tax=candidate division WOR_3 bacterium SM23_42 TaxID=1703779 RepID=A0A0S8FXN1_UNCW3|nr:MAG: hypothetical protein AMJ83_01650 [candidate division WOR_3 bacterium SM23_42]
MAEAKKSVKISFVILLIMLLLALVYGLITVFAPEFIVARSFEGFTGKPWYIYDAVVGVGGYIITLERMAGGLGLALTLGALIVLFTAYRKVEKWAWYYMLVVGVIGWVNNLIANIAFKNTVTTTIIIIGLILIIIGLLIPVKDFFSKK